MAFKVNDRVIYAGGVGIVVKINKKGTYPVIVSLLERDPYMTFTLEGRYLQTSDITLFSITPSTEKVIITPQFITITSEEEFYKVPLKDIRYVDKLSSTFKDSSGITYPVIPDVELLIREILACDTEI